eukprot:CAMPEP_0182853110 /NCGR_PEP_ID=MMETSP0034_2-20130328/525_1 /TAXON_ID=156128 /ORGANISM="Nephroselmis pyriformis, Strain CCMP717" /LENGTH=40 /DNA_ID= /DNA_START= /DNA_END= /DNA_ORIENTATION=
MSSAREAVLLHTARCVATYAAPAVTTPVAKYRECLGPGSS